MEQKIFDAVNAEIAPTLTENGFSKVGDIFLGETRAFKVEYNEGRKLFELHSAQVEGGTVGEYTVASSYLFEENGTVSDATAVGIDFLDTVMSVMGLQKHKTRTTMGEVALPIKSSGDNVGMDDLHSKLLAVFPQYKDAYKENVATNGEFLYVSFYVENFAAEIRNLLEADSGKKLRKLFDGLNDLFVKGDRAVSDAIIVLLLGGAVKGDAALAEKLYTHLEELPYLKSGVRNIIERTNKDKRLKEIYGM